MTMHMNIPPYLVGVYRDVDGEKFLPMSEVEIDRTMLLYRDIFDSCKIPHRASAVLITQYRDAALDLPIERAMVQEGIVPCHAEGTPFDAPRVESFLRLLDCQAVFGVTGDTLDGLQAAGHSAPELFAGRLIWARGEDAYQRLAGETGFTLLRWMEIGPAPGVECIYGGGMHVDVMDWDVEQDDSGRVLLTSRRLRCVDFEQVNTGVIASIDHSPCRCGIGGPRITPLA